MTDDSATLRAMTWRSVLGFEGAYEVSDTGLVRSLRPRHGRPAPWLMKPGKNSGSYQQYALYLNGRPHSKRAHILVLEAFVGPRPSDKHQGCHRDGDRQNNRLGNLYWGTRADNEADKRRHRTGTGDNKSQAKLTSEKVMQIRELLRARPVKAAIARQFGVSPRTINFIAKGQLWTHVPDHASRPVTVKE